MAHRRSCMGRHQTDRNADGPAPSIAMACAPAEISSTAAAVADAEAVTGTSVATGASHSSTERPSVSDVRGELRKPTGLMLLPWPASGEACPGHPNQDEMHAMSGEPVNPVVQGDARSNSARSAGRLIQFGMRNRTFDPHLAAIHGSLLPYSSESRW
jgi:hypothetical protein